MKTLKPFLLILLLPLMIMAQPKFVITGNEGKPIQDVIDAIRDECSNSCEIQFGNGTNVLDIGNSNIEFEGDWGEITLTGGIVSNSRYSTISIYEDISVVSKANIKSSNVESYGAIDNRGKLTVIGGNIKAEECAINSHGEVIINDGTIEAEFGAICNHYAELTINGGNIKAEYGAVLNDGDIINGESSFITINGGTIEAEYGAVSNDGGEVTITGGNIKAEYGAVGNGYYGKITIAGGNIEAEYGAVSNGNASEEHEYYTYVYPSEIIITGGNIKAKAQAVSNYGGEITIIDGTIEAIVAAVVNYEGKLTIKGGHIKAMGVAVINLDTRHLAMEALKLVITGGTISIIGGDIPLDLLFDIAEMLEEFLNPGELTQEDLIKYAVYYVGGEDYFSLLDDAIIEGEVGKSTGKNSPILLPQIANSQISIKAATNAIALENLPRNAKVDVYNLQGKLVSSKTFNQVNQGQIAIQSKGIYLVRIGKQAFRIAVK
jgi:hypothetical protein